MSNKEVRLLSNPGPRPPYKELAHYLWGNVDFDSDMNADVDPNWTELTFIRRPNYDERSDINPISENPLVLEIISSTPGLPQKTAEYLVKVCSGQLVVDPKDS